jgi:hypothetical protein
MKNQLIIDSITAPSNREVQCHPDALRVYEICSPSQLLASSIKAKRSTSYLLAGIELFPRCLDIGERIVSFGQSRFQEFPQI